MKPIPLAVFILLLSGMAFASDASISISNPPPSIAQGTDYSLQFMNVADEPLSATIQFYFGSQHVADKNISIPYGVSTNQITINLPNQDTQTAELRLVDMNFQSQNPDANPNNNSFFFPLSVTALPDLRAVSISVNPATVPSGTSVNIKGFVMNNSNSIASNYPIRLELDGQQLTQQVFSFQPFETKTIDYNWSVPSNFTGAHTIYLKANPGNAFPESDYSNNNFQYAISSNVEADLLINISDINFLVSPKVGQSGVVGFRIQNAGGQQATNFTVKAYQTSRIPSKLIYSTVVNALLPGASQSLQFNFTPQISGADQLIFVLDEENNVVELNKQNNVANFVFSASSNDSNDTVGYVHTLLLVKSCFFVMDNGDLVNVGGFDSNSRVQITIADASGNNYHDVNSNQPFDGWFAEGTELHALGLTFRVVSVHSNDATILLIYKSPTQIRNSSCNQDIVSCQTELSSTRTDLENAQAILWKWKADYETVQNNFNNCSSRMNMAQASATECQGNLSARDITISAQDKKTEEKLAEQKTNLDTMYQGQITGLNSQQAKTDSDLKKEKNFSRALLFVIGVMIIGPLGYIAFREKFKKNA